MNAIKYNLVPATMPNMQDSGKYVAQVQVRGSLGFDEMADRMIAQGSCVTKPDILAVFENLAMALETAMMEGFRVNFGGIFDMFPSISGTFGGITAPFDPAVNSVDVRARCGSRIRSNVMANASIERVYLPKPVPVLLSFTDLFSASSDKTVTPANVGTLAGQRLKFNSDVADEGVFFVSMAGDFVSRAKFVQRNTPKELVFMVPSDLQPGASYYVEVRARLNGTEELRVGRLGAVLAVSSVEG